MPSFEILKKKDFLTLDFNGIHSIVRSRTESATEVLVTININNKLKQNLDFCHLPVYILDTRKRINN